MQGEPNLIQHFLLGLTEEILQLSKNGIDLMVASRVQIHSGHSGLIIGFSPSGLDEFSLADRQGAGLVSIGYISQSLGIESMGVGFGLGFGGWVTF